MAFNQPIQDLKALSLNSEIEEQSSKWDCEGSLRDFEQALAMLDKISDALPDDPITTQALNGLHSTLSNIYADFVTELLPT
jgi:hypothetical protein